MKIFLSHHSRDKPLVREFMNLLPRFLEMWLDEKDLVWGETFPRSLESTIESGVDFFLIFLDREALNSAWVQQELQWAIARENELKRVFVLPVLLENVLPADLPAEFSDRQQLRLYGRDEGSVKELADRATLALFQLVAKGYAACSTDVATPLSIDAWKILKEFPHAVFIKDALGRYVWFNEAFKRMFAISSDDEFLDKTDPQALNRGKSDQPFHFVLTDNIAFHQDEPLNLFEFVRDRGERKDKPYYTVKSTVTGNDGAQYLLGICTDAQVMWRTFTDIVDEHNKGEYSHARERFENGIDHRESGVGDGDG